jgi:chitin synthase
LTEKPKDKMRTFNVFYEMLAGLTQADRETMKLLDAQQYSILTGITKNTTSGTNTLTRLVSLRRTKSKAGNPDNTTDSSDNKEDGEKFILLKEHLKSLGIGRRTQTQIWGVLAAILHLGNIVFFHDMSLPEGSPCSIKTPESLEMAATLLHISPQTLQNSLIYMSKLVGGDLCSLILSAEGAAIQRSRLTQTLYALLFSWIVEHINQRLCKPENEVDVFTAIADIPQIKPCCPGTSVACFDILVSNYISERLLNYLNLRQFDKIDTLILEGFEGSGVSYHDNQACVDLFMGTTRMQGLWNLIDTVITTRKDPKNVKRATEPIINTGQKASSLSTEMASTLDKNLKINQNYIKSSQVFVMTDSGTPMLSDQMPVTRVSFGIKHFGDVEVMYDLEGFLENDVIISDFLTLFRPKEVELNHEYEDTSFVASLFSKGNGIKTVFGGNGRVMGASMNGQPLRRPSLSRRKNKEVVESSSTLPEHLNIESNIPTSIFLTVNDSVEDLICLFDSTRLWTIYTSISKPHDVEQYNLNALSTLKSVTDVDANTGLSYAKFIEKFGTLLSIANSGASASTSTSDIKILVTKFIESQYWPPRQQLLGKTKVFLSISKWFWLNEEMTRLESLNIVNPNASEYLLPDPIIVDSGSTDWFAINGALKYDDENSETGSLNENENDSDYGYQDLADLHRSKLDIEFGFGDSNLKSESMPHKEIIEHVSEVTRVRRCWVCSTWIMTCWIPSMFLSSWGGMKRADIRMAWREKVAICILIFAMCAFLLFFVIGLGLLICPRVNVKSQAEIQTDRLLGDSGLKPVMSAYGRYYDLNVLMDQHIRDYGPGTGPSSIQKYEFTNFYGTDVSRLFYKADNWFYYCPRLAEMGLEAPPASWDNLDPSILWQNRQNVFPKSALHRGKAPAGYEQVFIEAMNKFAIGKVGWQLKEIKSMSSQSRVCLIPNRYRFILLFMIMFTT